ncbi:putative non-specific serine/threonine protein kinase [Rosa chinensis]|uniref:Putative non-specific serine/threonine protein kinase n=1 Tax=Rosa chinensis TaxID=74649 RepID=A0A2P6PPL5_ROSCH|nr:putative non-specific serine/threonine protein kinase [Rosa chinensis]
MRSGYISEKGDVYSFGVLLLVFLTGQEALIRYEEGGKYQSIIPYVKSHACDGQIETIVDPEVLREAKGDKHTQQYLHDFLALALLCTSDSSEARPDMIDVAKELV